MANLLIGPMLRYVDDTAATIWLETDGACLVEVLGHRSMGPIKRFAMRPGA